MMGFPVEYTRLIAAPTLLSTVSNLDRIIPSISQPEFPCVAERFLKESLNFVN